MGAGLALAVATGLGNAAAGLAGAGRGLGAAMRLGAGRGGALANATGARAGLGAQLFPSLNIVTRPSPGWLILTVSGLLVGWGTRQGGGCTSGHGVCGLGRLAPRSLVAVLVFMAAGIFTASLLRHWLGVPA